MLLPSFFFIFCMDSRVVFALLFDWILVCFRLNRCLLFFAWFLMLLRRNDGFCMDYCVFVLFCFALLFEWILVFFFVGVVVCFCMVSDVVT